MAFLNDKERQTLSLICDTLIPSLPAYSDEEAALYSTPASALNVAERLEQTVELTTDAANQFQIKMLLKGFDNGLFNGLMSGQWHSLAGLSPEIREAVLYQWATSRLFFRRKAFQAIKRLTMFLHYAAMPEKQHNPTWQSIGYSGPPGPGDAPRTIQPYILNGAAVLETDVLVIGSGAGGGVVAGELTAAGYDVIIAEKGGYHAEADFDGGEESGTDKFYENHGALTTADTSMTVLAGSTLGGGTTVNWSASFRTPDHVLQEWADNYGFSGATSDAYQASLDAVMRRVNVNSEESIPNPNNQALEKGCESLGYHVGVIPRNVKGCEDCGFCGYGCAFGAKQGTLKTYLQDAYARGARIVVQAKVEKILHSQGKVQGALITVTDSDGLKRHLTVKAKAVVVSAGAIHTPVLLKRSGLTNNRIGKNLRLHPVTVTFGIFDEEVLPWHGVPMSRFTKQFSNLDGRGYGATLETAPAHPGLTASALPWISARAHKDLMAGIAHMANIIVLTRDYYGGEVKSNKDGYPILDYTVHPYDARHMMRGMIEALKIHAAAGASLVCSSHNEQMMYRTGKDGRFDDYIKRVESIPFRPNGYALFSAHQMSSCHIAGSAAQGPVDPTGETYEVKNLFVADASAMPTSSGVNPMITIMGLSHYIAQQIKAKL